MKNELLIFLFFISILGSAQKSEYIIVKHIGEQLSSVNPITILLTGSKPLKIKKNISFFDKYPPSRDERSLIDTVTFTNLKTEIFNYSDSIKSKAPKEFPYYGSFKVSYFKNDKLQKTYSMYNIVESTKFFNFLSEKIPNVKDKEVIKLQFLTCLKLIELKVRKVSCDQYKWW